MADFDLVVTGNLVTAHRIVNDGFVAVSAAKSPSSGVARRRPRASRSMPAASG